MLDNPGRLVNQIVAESGSRADAVAVAVYLFALAAAGRTVAEAAMAADITRGSVRDIARRWAIRFVDFQPPIRRAGMKPARLHFSDTPAAPPAWGVSEPSPVGARSGPTALDPGATP